MFNFIKNFFSKKKTESEEKEKTNKPVASKKKQLGSISFNPMLIEGLKFEHQNLISIYQHIMDSAEKKEYPILLKALSDFSNALSAHLTKEDIELYIFLEFIAQGKDREVIRDFRLEMGGIAKIVIGVINKYNNTAVSDENVVDFIQEFSELGGVLVDRIEREEATLYPLYHAINE